MADFWLDADVFIESKNGLYGFDLVPGFWQLLDQKANEGVIASSTMVYDEIVTGNDDLASWARERRNMGLFVEPDEPVQATLREIADFVVVVHVRRDLGAGDIPLVDSLSQKQGNRQFLAVRVSQEPY